jgi:ribosomal protein L11 methyltransferase
MTASSTSEGLDAAGTWLELAVECDQEAVEAVSEILARVCPGGVTVEPAYELVEEGLAARIDASRPAVVRGYLPGADASGARAGRAAVEEALGHLQAFGLRPIGELHTRVVHEEDWAHAWKRHFPVLRIGRRLVIQPTWREHQPKPDDVVLALDPGMAFGTGLHPTTRLCLEGVERWADEGLFEHARVLDVGCGSGILAIAAARLGAPEVLGVDTDPVAVQATHANAALNGCSDAVSARRGSLPVAEAPFDLVLANLIASLLVSIAGELGASVAAGGRILCSGIFVDRESEVRASLEGAGLRISGSWREGDWVALEARAPGGA